MDNKRLVIDFYAIILAVLCFKIKKGNLNDAIDREYLADTIDKNYRNNIPPYTTFQQGLQNLYSQITTHSFFINFVLSLKENPPASATTDEPTSSPLFIFLKKHWRELLTSKDGRELSPEIKNLIEDDISQKIRELTLRAKTSSCFLYKSGTHKPPAHPTRELKKPPHNKPSAAAPATTNRDWFTQCPQPDTPCNQQGNHHPQEFSNAERIKWQRECWHNISACDSMHRRGIQTKR